MSNAQPSLWHYVSEIYLDPTLVPFQGHSISSYLSLQGKKKRIICRPHQFVFEVKPFLIYMKLGAVFLLKQAAKHVCVSCYFLVSSAEIVCFIRASQLEAYMCVCHRASVSQLEAYMCVCHRASVSQL